VRFKNRYFLIEIIYSDSSQKIKNESDILESIKSSIKSLFGDFGRSVTSSMNIKYFNGETGLFIIRVDRDFYQMLWSSMTLIHRIQEVSLFFRVIHIGGTFKSCKQHAIDYDKEMIKYFKFFDENQEKEEMVEDDNQEKDEMVVGESST